MTTQEQRPVAKTGYDLIRDPSLNKGTAFTARERRELGLDGLLPSERNSIETQERRVYASIQGLEAPLDRYVSLSSLQDRNEHLFYRLLVDHLEALMPIVYTPTVGEATKNFSHVFQRGRGVWITPDFKGRIADVLRNAVPDGGVRLIVATDNESILGIGDQGAGGMAISIGKLALYVAGAGIAPWQTLPVSIDVGTDNEALLNDELYLGWRQPRLRGADYDALIDEFVEAVTTVFPGVLVQWEDFRKDNALAILDRHRDGTPSFNDDIQGTGAVALAALLSAGRISRTPLSEQRVLIYGAGAAGMGIARQIRAAMVREGLSDAEALAHVGVLDSRGLLVSDNEIRDAYKRDLAWPLEHAASLGLGDPAARGLDDVVGKYRPTVLIGTSGQTGSFHEGVVRAMAATVDRPTILPFSNPTDRAEATPADLIAWTDGRALVATGSPFAPVQHAGREFRIGQGNNVFVFPGIGLGALECGARVVTDGMVSAASEALALAVDDAELEAGMLFPAIPRLREVSARVALAVALQAQADGVTDDERDSAALDQAIRAAMWWPDYPEYRKAE